MTIPLGLRPTDDSCTVRRNLLSVIGKTSPSVTFTIPLTAIDQERLPYMVNLSNFSISNTDRALALALHDSIISDAVIHAR